MEGLYQSGKSFDGHGRRMKLLQSINLEKFHLPSVHLYAVKI
jgi:hypothetical protein